LKNNAIKIINTIFESLSILAIELIESEARKILINDPELEEFIMAMGSCFFTTTNKERGHCPSSGGANIIASHKMEDCEDFFEIIDDFNEQFNIKGHPMRFTATGKVENNW
jgi:hypothetical protein